MKSWKTTALGVVGALTILLGQMTAVLDSDPATVFELDVVIAALGLLGLGWFARDNNVTSERAGAK